MNPCWYVPRRDLAARVQALLQNSRLEIGKAAEQAA
jgi:hypothetical protein